MNKGQKFIEIKKDDIVLLDIRKKKLVIGRTESDVKSVVLMYDLNSFDNALDIYKIIKE